MKLPFVGPLLPHSDIPEWLTSPPVPISYFDGMKLTFTLDALEDNDERDVTSAIESFLRLGPKDRLAASPYVYKYYQHSADSIDAVDLGCRIDSVADVWNHVRPTEVFVARRHRGDNAIYIQITAECDWDPEHGLQIIYRRGSELSRVSFQDGHLTHADAFGLTDDQDQIVE